MTIEAVMFVGFLILFNIISYKMAESRGRNVYIWTGLSLIISPIISWVILAVIGKTDEKEQLDFNRLQSGLNATVEYK